MHNELISIIIPVYNTEKYIGQCIESVIAQTYTNIELILINDGSTDSSLEVCKSYEKDSRIRVIDKVNEGIGITRQLGIYESNGDYICMIDADDILHEEYVEKLYENIKRYSADISVCARESFVGAKGENTIPYLLEEGLPAVLDITREYLEENYAEITRQYHMNDSWNKMYRKEFIESTGIIFTMNKKYNGAEYLFNHLLVLHLPKITVVNEILYYYRILQNSRVRRKDKKLYEGFFYMIEELTKEIQKCNYNDKIFKELNTIYLYMMRYASSDIMNEQIEESEKRKKIQIFVDANTKFQLENNIVVRNIKLPTVGMRYFKYCFNMKSANGIIFYYKTRDLAKKILMKA